MYYFIVNPASASNHAMTVWEKVKNYLEKEKVSYEVFFSKKQGNVEELMRTLCDLHKNDAVPANIVVLGGDGTFNEAVQGISDFSKFNIGYIPSGSSNDFARALGYSPDPLVSIEKIVNCKEPVPFDVGVLEYLSISDEKSCLEAKNASEKRYFNVSCGIGFDAAICEGALRSRLKVFLNKLGLGKLIYGLIALKLVFTDKLCTVKLFMDNGTEIVEEKCRFAVSMNTCYEGGGYKFTPDALPNDGILDICTAGNISPFKLISMMPAATKGNHVKLKQVHIFRTKACEIQSEFPMWVHTDGEVYTKSDNIKISVLEGALRFLQ